MVESDMTSEGLLVFGWLSTLRAYLLDVQMCLHVCFNAVLVAGAFPTKIAHPQSLAIFAEILPHVLYY